MAKYFTHHDTACSVGDTVRVHVQIKEENDKTRIQIFEGILIAVSNRETNKMFTVRKIASDGVGVERIFPVESPAVVRLEIKQKGDVRRSKLHYLRDKVGKAANKIKQELVSTPQP